MYDSERCDVLLLYLYSFVVTKIRDCYYVNFVIVVM